MKHSVGEKEMKILNTTLDLLALSQGKISWSSLEKTAKELEEEGINLYEHA